MRHLPPFTLTDTGPLVSLCIETDPNYLRACDALKRLPSAPLLTLWPCMTEAMYLLDREGGYPAQAVLLDLLSDGSIQLWNPDETQAVRLQRRVVELMAAYRNIPCDFADAALVAAAEILSVRQIFTFDGHFYAYRTDDGDALDVLPGPSR